MGYLLPLKTDGQYLCIDTELFNALNNANLNYVWDYKNKGLKFDGKEDYEEAIRLKKLYENTCSVNQQVISNTPTVISNVPKEKPAKKGKLF